ncbi:MAG: hypothetical protein Q9161_003107 [Pseudevernia consocians]
MPPVVQKPFILTPIDNVLPRYQVSKLLFFPSSKCVTTTETIDALRNGLEKILQAFPLLTGTVQEIQPALDHEQKGRLCVSAPWHTMSDIFTVQDLTDNGTLDYSRLRAEKFPGYNLDAATLLPRDKESQPNAKSVMLAKVNKIRGGLIVVHTMSHAFMDGGGMAVIAKIWAAFCRGEDGAKYLTQDVLDRSRLMHGTDGSHIADFPELTHRFQIDTGVPATAVPQQDIQYEIFFFSREKLDELKKMASTAGDRGDENKDWISTSDALCALLTHSIMNTREERTPLTLGLAMDFRAYLDPPLPSDYIGNAVHMLDIHTAPPTDDLVSTIAKTAYQIRWTIQAINEKYIHRVIGALNSDDVPDISNIFHTRVGANGGQFLTITSWARQPFYELDWGEKVGTRIERVRVPRFQYPSLVLIAPILKGVRFEEDEEGGVEVIFGLEAREMEGLKGDVLFGRFARW